MGGYDSGKTTNIQEGIKTDNFLVEVEKAVEDKLREKPIQ